MWAGITRPTISLLLVRRASGPLNRNLLDSPRRAVALVDHRIGFAVELVNEAAGLAMTFAGLRPADEIAGHIELVDLPVPVAAERVLVWKR